MTIKKTPVEEIPQGFSVVKYPAAYTADRDI